MEPPPLLVLYGSETGNARDVAERIAREAARDGGGHTMTRRPRRRVHCLPMDSFEVTQLPTAPLIVCVCSTTGQGDPPANMRQFWRFLLRKSLPPDSLADVKFAVFGLGDSHYQKYNVAAKKLHRRMRALGAVELVGLGLGDDQHPTGYEATLDPWLDELWRSLGHGTDAEGGHGDKTDLGEDLVLDPCRVAVDVVAPPPVGSTQHESHDNVEDRVCELCDAARELDRALEAAAAIPPRLLRGTHETVGPNGEVAGTMSVVSSLHTFGEYHPAVATVTVNTPLTAADADAEVRHLEVATADLRRAPANSESTTGISDVNADELPPPLYNPGDCLAVLPLPLAECDVTRARDATGTVLQRAGLAPDAWVTLRAAGGRLGGRSEFISKPVRAASLVEGALDLTSASARRYFFEVASTFASHPQESERLRHFAGKDGRDELWYYNERERRSVAEFLSDFPSVTMPLEWMLTTAPRLRHRLFSIASSPLPYPHALHLTVTAARWKTHYGRIREGLCSNVLRRCVSTFIFIRAIRLTARVFCVQRSSRRSSGVLARPDRDGSTEGYHAPGISVHRVGGGAAQGVRAGTGPQGTGWSIQDRAHVGILRLPEKSG